LREIDVAMEKSVVLAQFPSGHSRHAAAVAATQDSVARRISAPIGSG